MANASVALSDFWAIQNNQAGLAFLKNISAGIYVENKFLVKELNYRIFGFCLPTRSGVFALNINYFGYNLYNESKLGIAYAKAFGDSFSAGIELNYMRIAIGEGYGNKNLVSFEFGLLYSPVEQLNIGFHAFNPTGIWLLALNDECLSTKFRLGITYQFSLNLLISIESEKQLSTKPSLKTGLEYNFNQKFFIRTGVSTNPVTYAFGAGLLLNKLRIDLASSIHQVLGYSPQLSIIYLF